MRYIIILLISFFHFGVFGQFDFENRFVVSSYVEHHNTIADLDNDGNSDLIQVTFAFDQDFCRDLVYQLLWKQNVGDGVFKEPTLIYEFEST